MTETNGKTAKVVPFSEIEARQSAKIAGAEFDPKAWLEAQDRETRITRAGIESVHLDATWRKAPAEIVMVLNRGKPSEITLKLPPELTDHIVPLLVFEARSLLAQMLVGTPMGAEAKAQSVSRCCKCGLGPDIASPCLSP